MALPSPVFRLEVIPCRPTKFSSPPNHPKKSFQFTSTTFMNNEGKILSLQNILISCMITFYYLYLLNCKMSNKSSQIIYVLNEKKCLSICSDPTGVLPYTSCGCSTGTAV